MDRTLSSEVAAPADGARRFMAPSLNALPEVIAGFEVPSSVEVIDCTLREGEQTPGVVIRRDDKLRLAEALVTAGFTALEIGMPAISEYEAETVRQIVGLGLKCKMHVICMARPDDIDRASACGVDSVGISLPSGTLQLRSKLRWSHERVIETAIELSRRAHELGLLVTLSPYDTPRSDLDFLERYVREAYLHGHVDQVRLVDTVGCATPELMAFLVRRLRAWTDDLVPIEAHCHNDFGLAIANTMASVTAGARAVSTTVNGLGERAGGAPTELAVLALELLYGVRTRIDLTQLRRLSTIVSAITGMPIRPFEPVVGESTFAMETGSVISGYLKDPLVAFPYLPAVIGTSASFLLGKKSGRHSIVAKAAELGIGDIEGQAAERLLSRVKAYAEEAGRTVPDEVFLEWCDMERTTSEPPSSGNAR